MSNRHRFWKPGFETGDQSTDRPEEGETERTNFVYNPHSSLSIQKQRQRLPIFKNRNHILHLLENYQTLIIVGETGCGKSTQIPQYLLEAGWCSNGMVIGITEPRRVAAITLATRVSEEYGGILGQEVGYSVRFNDNYNPKETKIKFMTEGILVREMMGDPLLRSYSVLMLDEIHERTMYSDIILGLLKKILKKRLDLCLIISSATLEAEMLQEFFNFKNNTIDGIEDTSVILSIEGREFPVDVYYLKEPTPDYVKASVDTAMKIHYSEEKGDILIFLTGQEEVESAVTLLIEHAKEIKQKQNHNKIFVLPMYGALPASDQMKVFQSTPNNVRKIVVATNIAEASLTINGIVFVIDCGFVKLRCYNPYTNTDSLIVVPVSQASAEQRAGRAGRVRFGKVYRLYTEEDYHKLEKNTRPEIQRTSLTSILLQLKALGIDNILRFNFPAPPASKNVINALELLYALGALDDDGKLTNPLGVRMAEFPLHPMFAKMLLVSAEFGCSEEAATIVALLQVQNIFLSPPRQTMQAKKMKYKFSVTEGDHITLLNVYNAFIKQETNKKKWCESNFLHYKGLQRVTEIRNQIIKLLQKFKIKLISSEGDVDTICRCIVAGFFANAAYLHHSGEYKTIRGEHTLHIHPSSVVYSQKQPQWVVFNEVLHTTKEYMRDITVVEASWLYELAPHYYEFGTDREIAENRQKS
ncbi:probable ATP-dependent RNA helicase DHX35 [Centruroides vittatus]|uniref:probable ATP-dependent RNA helicase DHX35 n=1 Tax=Centruroides vittatus TaxID=120091 RepID=UPI00350ED89D